jgi:hypothetical protein
LAGHLIVDHCIAKLAGTAGNGASNPTSKANDMGSLSHIDALSPPRENTKAIRSSDQRPYEDPTIAAVFLTVVSVGSDAKV